MESGTNLNNGGLDKKTKKKVIKAFLIFSLVLIVIIALSEWNKSTKIIDNFIADTFSECDNSDDFQPETLRSYDGLILDENKRPVGFDIGEFNDLEEFSETAQKDFKGKIRYRICPSKDCKQVSIIEIPRTKASVNVLFTEEQNLDGNYDVEGVRYYGPTIFRRGETWKIWGTSPTENKHTGGWQPLCYWQKVFLTPEAKSATNRLLKLLRDLKDLRLTENGFEKRNGVLLTKEELELAIKYGIIETERKWLFFNEPTGISSKYKVVQKYLHSKERKFSNTPTYETLKGITLGVNKELFAKQLQTNEIVENIKAEQITDNASVVSGIEFSELDGKVGGFEWNFDNDILTSITFSFWEETEYERNANVKQIISSYLDSKYIKVSETSYKNQCMSVDIRYNPDRIEITYSINN